MRLLKLQLTTKQMDRFCHELRSLLDAGIPAKRALDLMARRRRGALKDSLVRMGDVIAAGGTLAQALRAESGLFPRLFVELMAVGEQSGKLEAVLERLARHYRDRLAIQQQYVSALAYPAAVVVGAYIGVPFIVGLLKGAFIPGTWPNDSIEMYTLYFFLDVLRYWGPPLLLLWVLVRTGLAGRIVPPIATYVEPLRGIVRRFALGRFWSTLAILTDAGLPVHDAIERAAAVVTNPFVARDLRKAVPAIQRGQTLDEAFRHCKWLDANEHAMVFVGEQSGKLEESFENLARWHFESAFHRLRSFGFVVESLAILLLAGLLFTQIGRQATAALKGFFDVYGHVRSLF